MRVRWGLVRFGLGGRTAGGKERRRPGATGTGPKRNAGTGGHAHAKQQAESSKVSSSGQQPNEWQAGKAHHFVHDVLLGVELDRVVKHEVEVLAVDHHHHMMAVMVRVSGLACASVSERGRRARPRVRQRKPQPPAAQAAVRAGGSAKPGDKMERTQGEAAAQQKRAFCCSWWRVGNAPRAARRKRRTRRPRGAR